MNQRKAALYSTGNTKSESMDPRAHELYLESQVLTATPQKLRLMLIDGAIAAARQTLTHWDEDDPRGALQSVSRCRQMIGELLAGIRPDKSDLSKQVATVYVFLYRLLTEAQLQRDASAVHKAIEILSVERGTWQMVCDKMPNAPIPTADTATQEISAADAERMLSAERSEAESPESTTGFVLDA